VLAFIEGRAVAGALNFIGGDALYGRYWGAVIDKPFLHFELCYYQAIDAAIALGLARVEAGAQGQHKLARGYAPVQTTSAHYIAHPRSARPWPIFWSANARAWRQTPIFWKPAPRSSGASETAPGHEDGRAGGGSGRAAVQFGQPGARAALGLGDFAGGHFLGHFGAADLGFFMPGNSGQVEPFVRLGQIALRAMAAGGKGHAKIEIGRNIALRGGGQAALHQIIGAGGLVAGQMRGNSGVDSMGRPLLAPN
jgi:hypothetical protein